MSHPPDYPGRQRLKRASARAGSDAYQGAFEAVGAVLVGVGFGFWVDSRWETGPWGVLVGVVLGFAAMVLRLVRLGKELNPDALGANEAGTETESPALRDPAIDDEFGFGVAPGMSDVLREDDAKQTEVASATDASSRNNETE